MDKNYTIWKTKMDIKSVKINGEKHDIKIDGGKHDITSNSSNSWKEERPIRRYSNEIILVEKKDIVFDSNGVGSFTILSKDYHRKYLYFCGLTYPSERVDAVVIISVDEKEVTDYIPMLKTNEMFVNLGEKATVKIKCSAFANSKRSFLVKLSRGDEPILIVGAPVSTDTAITSTVEAGEDWATDEYKLCVDIPVTFSNTTETVVLVSTWKSTPGVIEPRNQVNEIIITVLNNNGSDLDYFTTPQWNLMFFKFRKHSTVTEFFGECAYRVDNILNVRSPINNENLVVEIENIPSSVLPINVRIMACVKYLYL